MNSQYSGFVCIKLCCLSVIHLIICMLKLKNMKPINNLFKYFTFAAVGYHQYDDMADIPQ